MNEIKVELENCYGINKLSYTFDFRDRKIYSIYAPNGVMKTSFAKTFKDLSQNKDSLDLMFPDKTTIRNIKDELGTDILPDNIFVIESYKEQFSDGKISTLLVNEELKTRYDEIHSVIDEAKKLLFVELKILSGLTKTSDNIQKEIINSFDSDFFETLEELEETILAGEAEYSTIKYNEIFNSKVLTFLKTTGVSDIIVEYIERYNELLSDSPYFQSTFNLSHVTKVQKQLEQNHFFTAGHSVNMFDGENTTTIPNTAELEELIRVEKVAIFSDARLQTIYNKIDTKIKNKELEQFRDYLLTNREILTELVDIDSFSKKLWISYFITNAALYTALLAKYRIGKEEIAEIVQSAKEQETTWENVIKIFNERFSVAFSLKINNQDDVILKDTTPSLDFIFKDLLTGETVEKTRSELFEVLSLGERRAFYLLNIIFEVEVRKQNQQETLFIVDDIADSFDYKNKYAIIEYLKDISKFDFFSQIILTHNFDFYRTISSRLLISGNKKLNVLKTNQKIDLLREKYQNNPFLHWKDNLEKNDIMLIASIPFIRNLSEYCTGTNSNEYNKLTSLLHVKEDTKNLNITDLGVIYKNILIDKSTLVLNNGNIKVIDLIYSLSDEIVIDTSEIMELEIKIVLAIAIRLKTEDFMILSISDDTFMTEVYSSGKAQFYPIFTEYQRKFSTEKNSIKLIEQVNLMTPENIHLNAFMYEPILDMSNHHLKKLYTDISDLSN
ncbi:hypothetical protein [Sulfurimonas sp.]|uniref:hypothetical protein n=1 Tax=Sulfurimonas sp. TaxID=2022749 RepID=UPI002AB1EBCE|nr:hypothetical protein [Sulfurimonas sp.]